MATDNNFAHPFPRVTGQVLLPDETNREGLHQTTLTGSESSGSKNPPISNTSIDSKDGTLDQATIHLDSGDNILRPLARQGNVTHHIDIQGSGNKPPQTVNDFNTVLHTFDSLHNITPQLQKLTKVQDKFGNSTYIDMGLRYHLIQEDSLEPYLWDLIEGE